MIAQKNAATAGTRPGRGWRGRTVRTCAAAGFGVLLILALHSRGHLFLREALNWTILWIPPALLLALYGREAGREKGRVRIPGPVAVLILTLVLSLMSSLVRHRWFFFPNWIPVGDPRDSGLFQFVFLTALLTPIFAWRRWHRRATGWLLAAGAVWMAVLSLSNALDTMGGRAFYRTDHPSTMFRLWEFGETFPALGGYNPMWNAGIEHFAGVTSGAHGLGLLIYPLLRLAPVHTFYSEALLVLFIIVTPLIAALSVKAVGGGLEAMAAGALLALGCSQHFFLWFWHYGTVGAVLSASMVVPVTALAYRAAVRHRLDPATFFGLFAAGLLMLMWKPLAPAIGIGLLGAYLGARRHWNRRSFRFLLACGALILLAYLPWLRVTLFPGRGALDYVARAGGEPRTLGVILSGGAGRLAANLVKGHPVLLFLGLGGAAFAAPRSIRRWYLPVLAFLAVLTGWSLEVNPLSQLDRLALPLLFAAIVPAALCAGRALRASGWRSAPARAALFAVLLLGGYNVSHHYANRGLARAQPMPEELDEFVEWIRAEVPENGRLLFAGRAVHGYGWGKIAYLPVLAGREMMADDYYGFPRGIVEFEYPPQPYRDSAEGYLAYASAYNVTHIVTIHNRYREQFDRHPEVFQPAWVFDPEGANITAYRVLRPAPMLPSAGRVRAAINRIVVEFDEEPEDVILPYDWRNGLFSRTPGAEIGPHAYDNNIRLIAVRPHGSRRVEIGYRTPWGPLEPNFDGRPHR